MKVKLFQIKRHKNLGEVWQCELYVGLETKAVHWQEG